MGPANLAAGGVQGVIGPSAIGGADLGEALAKQLRQLALVAVGGDVEGGRGVGDGAPGGALFARLTQLGAGRRSVPGGALADCVDRAGRDLGAKELSAATLTAIAGNSVTWWQ